MSDAEERAPEVSSRPVQEHNTAVSQPAGQHEDNPTQDVTSTTLTSAGNTSATPFERLSSSLNQSPAKETPPAGKTKARKPYTITKQREKWTDEEHGLFLEALELHGRAWRRIEEHIGTKTAVQIRSHAQKFFSKLEKEQSGTVKTEGSCKSGGIDIPPPRPKRKPSHPYPRKPEQASPDSNTPTTWQGSPPGCADLPHSFSRESLGTSAGYRPIPPTETPFAQASPPKGFPFFGIPPSAFSQPGCQPDMPLQPQASQQAAPLLRPRKSQSSDAGDGKEGTATSDHLHTQQQQQGLLKAHTQPQMYVHPPGISNPHILISNSFTSYRARVRHGRLCEPSACWSSVDATACIPQYHTPWIQQSAHTTLLDPIPWPTSTIATGSGRSMPNLFSEAHACKRHGTDMPNDQDRPQPEQGGSDGSDADNVRGNQGDQFGDNLLFRHMQLQRAETQDAGESARTQTRLQGAQPEGGDSNPGSEGNGSGSDGAGNCQGSGNGSGHGSRVGNRPISAQGTTQQETPCAQQRPVFHHREAASMQQGTRFSQRESAPLQVCSSVLPAATSQAASAMSPLHPSWGHAPATSGNLPMGMSTPFQPAPMLNGHPHIGGPAHSQPLPIDPLQRASSLLEQQMAPGQHQPPPPAGTKDGAPSWESSAALWHPTARRPLACGSPSPPDCLPPAGSMKKSEAASGVSHAAPPVQVPLRAHSTPVLAEVSPCPGETAAVPMRLPLRSSGTVSGFKPYRPCSAASDAAGVLDSRLGITAGVPVKRKLSVHLAGAAPPKKRHLLQQEA
ncbi:hypothetical protein WJX74_000097 [Apatococcus lobatus]|uniref:LHY n=1 Tax=Apatococcus lobatus TaxID=904363 RepID=A0AAW1RUY7_9CHLO